MNESKRNSVAIRGVENHSSKKKNVREKCTLQSTNKMYPEKLNFWSLEILKITYLHKYQNYM